MNIIVTGASRGIGCELVKHFCHDEANHVLAIARSKDQLKQLAAACKPGKVSTLEADLSKKDFMEKALPLINERMTAVDVLVNNAGLLAKSRLGGIGRSEMETIFSVNVFAALELTQGLLPLLEKSKAAHVVNIGSIGGFQGSGKYPGLSVYSASKAALACLSECMALELKERGIKVNCLALGAVETAMLKQAFPDYKAPVTASEMAGFIADFSINGHKKFNGKIIPVSLSTP